MKRLVLIVLVGSIPVAPAADLETRFQTLAACTNTVAFARLWPGFVDAVPEADLEQWVDRAGELPRRDFQVEVRYESSIAEAFQEQGIIAELDNSNFLRFEVYANGENIFAFASMTVGGAPTPLVNTAILPAPSPIPLYLRVSRVGNLWSFEHSTDGFTWIENVAFLSTMNVVRIGPHVGNADPGGGAPETTAARGRSIARAARRSSRWEKSRPETSGHSRITR